MSNDRRVRKTKHALRMGLAELLTRKSIQQITVKELVEKVDIHRSTFYANFEDIYDLYQHMEDVIIEEISSIVTSNLTLFSPTAFIEILLKYIMDNKQISQLFFSGKVSKTFTNRMTDLFLTAYGDCFRQRRISKVKATDEQLKYYALFCFSGMLAMIEKWVIGEFTCSREELINMLVSIDQNFEEFVAKQFS